MLEKVRYVKDLTKPGKTALLVTSNNEYAVLADYDTKEQFWAAFDNRKKAAMRLTKVRLDRIEAMSTVPEVAPTPKPSPSPKLPTAKPKGSTVAAEVVKK